MAVLSAQEPLYYGRLVLRDCEASNCCWCYQVAAWGCVYSDYYASNYCCLYQQVVAGVAFKPARLSCMVVFTFPSQNGGGVANIARLWACVWLF